MLRVTSYALLPPPHPMSQPVITTHQPSLTEWFEAIGERVNSELFREEDNHKTDRLEILYQMIGLPYERPEPFPAREMMERGPIFNKILEERGNELCAIRLVPNRSDLPKLRQRGLTIKECYETWLVKQTINPDDYTAYLCPHSETLLWSATFVVNQEAIFGEIVEGLHSQLTHGDTKNILYQFRYDFDQWQWSEESPIARREMERIVKLIYVPDQNTQRSVKEKLDVQFSHDYLVGYFEATVWPDNKVYIIDYNRLLPKYISTPPSFVQPSVIDKTALRGSPAYSGVVQGTVVIVNALNLSTIDFLEGSILVCDNTDVRYLPLMRRAAAIVTDRGGILSHAAIVARELKKPCIIGTKIATQVLKDGDLIEVNADQGVVSILKPTHDEGRV